VMHGGSLDASRCARKQGTNHSRLMTTFPLLRPVSA
jgi:hypothetical protein